MTVYNFDTIDVDGKPEAQLKCLKELVGERGFEPPTPWSRTSPLRLTNFAKEINRLPSGDLACIMPHMGSGRVTIFLDAEECQWTKF